MKLKIKKGKGVLGKDKRPFAPGTLHVTCGNWHQPCYYTPEAFAEALVDVNVSEIQLITKANDQYTITIDRS